jgi:hypothetical protein
VLEDMTRRWPMAKHCHQVLSSLVANLRKRSSKRITGMVHNNTNRNNRQRSGLEEKRMTTSQPVAQVQNELPRTKRRRTDWQTERHQSEDGSYIVSLPERSPSFRQIAGDEEDHPHADLLPQAPMHHTDNAYKQNAVSTVTYDLTATSEAQSSAYSQWTTQNPVQTGSADPLSSIYINMNADSHGFATAEPYGGPNHWRRTGSVIPLGLPDSSAFDIFGSATWESLIDAMDMQGF